MKPDKNTTKASEADRRGFLRMVGIGGVVGGVAAATAAAPAQAAGDTPSEGGSGYRETEHVRTYYDLARF